MNSTAGGNVEKVTQRVGNVAQKVEAGNSEVLRLLIRAVRTIHGRRDQDLEQEVFIRTLEAFRRTRLIVHPEAFIWKVVRDTVADHWRTRRRDRPTDVAEVAEHLLAERPSVEEAIDRKRQIESLHRAISRLGCDIRGPVYLFYVEDYPIAKIARLYGKSASAIKMALHRGRRRIEQICRGNAT